MRKGHNYIKMLKKYALGVLVLALSSPVLATSSLNIPEPTAQSCTDKEFLDNLEKRLQNDFTKHEITRQELYSYQKFSSQCLLLLQR